MMQDKRAHFVGIAGSGMSGIAEIMSQSGYIVSGTDQQNNEITDRLKKLGIKIFHSHEAENLKEVDFLVISSAVKEENPEVQEALRLGLLIKHRSDMLFEVMTHKYQILIAGTHGKTTTSSIMAESFFHAGTDISFAIGGVLKKFNSNAYCGKSDYFIAEVDESDGTFLKFNPNIVVLSNVDKDHLDYYKDFQAIKDAFISFCNKVADNGVICLCLDDPINREICVNIKAKIITYGVDPNADIYAADIQMDGIFSSFIPIINGKKLSRIKLPLPGKYNISNALASIAVASFLKLNMEKFLFSLEKFSGVLHRFTVLGHVKNTTVVDDYAHNPKKIESVISGSKNNFPNHKIIVIFQPHRYSRTFLQLNEFASSFRFADHVIITPIYSSGELPIYPISSEILLNKISEDSFGGAKDSLAQADSLNDCADMCVKLIEEKYCDSENLVLTLGAGNVSLVGKSLLEKLKIVTNSED